MQNPYGQIVSISEGRSRRQAVVVVEAANVCERCASGKGCGAGVFGTQTRGRRLAASVADDQDLGVGDLVSVVLESKNLLRAAVMVYGYPLSGAVLAVIAAYATGLSDAAAALAAVGGLFAGMLVARARLRNSRCRLEFTPTVVARLSPASD